MISHQRNTQRFLNTQQKQGKEKQYTADHLLNIREAAGIRCYVYREMSHSMTEISCEVPKKIFDLISFDDSLRNSFFFTTSSLHRSRIA